ncbi:hypothetical protein [Mucilaginibacter sp.]
MLSQLKYNCTAKDSGLKITINSFQRHWVAWAFCRYTNRILYRNIEYLHSNGSVKEDGVSIPIVLRYRSSGIQNAEEATNVGLSCAIIQVINGMPD